MIRELIGAGAPGGKLPGGERAMSMYRMWHCFDCGLDFSLKSRRVPLMCPSCAQGYESNCDGLNSDDLVEVETEVVVDESNKNNP